MFPNEHTTMEKSLLQIGFEGTPIRVRQVRITSSKKNGSPEDTNVTLQIITFDHKRINLIMQPEDARKVSDQFGWNLEFVEKETYCTHCEKEVNELQWHLENDCLNVCSGCGVTAGCEHYPNCENAEQKVQKVFQPL